MQFTLIHYRLYAHFTYVPLDVSSMRRAAAYLVGTHDFKSFCSVDTQAQTTVWQVDSVEVWEENIFGVADVAKDAVPGREIRRPGREIVIRVAGRGFL